MPEAGGLVATGFHKKLVHDFLPVAKVRALEPIKCFRQVEQTTQGGALQDAKSPGKTQTLIEGRLCLFALVDQNQVGIG